jgi:predicted transcriptional regulator
MNHVKEEAIKIIQALPDDITLKDIRYHLHVHEKVQAGLLALEEGRVVSQEEAERKVAEWVKALVP